jgi:uncharacterized protein YbjT (DUF2867 family)
MIPQDAVYVVGASGRSGTALCRALLEDGVGLVPVVRNAARWTATGLPGDARMADLTDPVALRAALVGATRIVSCAHARHVPAVLQAAPAAGVFVFLGSTRKFSRWPDAHGDGVRAGEAAFLASGRPGVMLHPTMIYGAQGEDNVQRLAALLRRLPAVPLPGGGRALVQPIHQSDVTRSVRAALRQDWVRAEALVIAGPAPMPYADFARAIAFAAGLRRPRIVTIPAAALQIAAMITRFLPGLPTIHPEEIRRLLEDKSFDIGPMRTRLGVEPITIHTGLATLFTSNTPAKSLRCRA